ncbi:MAG: phosphate acyltransferase PlsX [Acidobacteriota bacterium]|jgi:phosphate acyltransferase
MAIRIALDAMGGDHAPATEVLGAVEAFRRHGVHTVLVGDRERLERELARLKVTEGIDVEHAEEVVAMDDPPLTPIRKKKKSSLRIAAEMVKAGKAQGLVTAGNTGAAMATAKLVIGGHEAVERPALATWVPNRKGASLLLDVGANSDCKPLHLEQFAIMGAVYASQVLQKDHPRVALLSIGEEDIKGNDLTKETYKRLSTHNMNFVGNVEGHDLFSGSADVIVTDGFTGNVVLKTGESVYEFIGNYLREGFRSTARARLGYLLSAPVFKGLKEKLDYAEYGGALLVGIKAVTLICHGRSKPRAIMNALKVARDFCASGLNDKIGEEIRQRMKEHGNGKNSVAS